MKNQIEPEPVMASQAPVWLQPALALFLAPPISEEGELGSGAESIETEEHPLGFV